MYQNWVMKVIEMGWDRPKSNRTELPTEIKIKSKGRVLEMKK